MAPNNSTLETPNGILFQSTSSINDTVNNSNSNNSTITKEEDENIKQENVNLNTESITTSTISTTSKQIDEKESPKSPDINNNNNNNNSCKSICSKIYYSCVNSFKLDSFCKSLCPKSRAQQQQQQQQQQRQEQKTIDSLPNLVLKLIFKFTFFGVWPSFDFFTLGRVCKKWRRLVLGVVTCMKIEEFYVEEQRQCQSWVSLIRRWFKRHSDSSVPGERKICFIQAIALRIGLSARCITQLVQDIFEHCNQVDLDLSANRLGSDGVKLINRLVSDDGRQTLSSLNLASNKILDTGLIELATALKTNDSIHTLNLSQNLFGSEGLCALFDTLANHNSTVTDLNIEGSSLYDAAASIAKALQSNTCMLTHLNISSTQSYDSNVIDGVLYNITRLRVLKVNDNQINPVSCGILADALSKPECQLSVLELNNNNIGDDGLYELVRFFKTNSSLETFSLRNNNLTFCGISHLCHALSYPNVQIRDLDLSNNPLSINATPYLSFLFSRNPNKSLRIARLRFCQISDFGAQMLSQSLSANNSLTYLDLNGNNIHPEGCQHIAKLVTKNSSIRTLMLGNNSIGNTGAQYIADAIKDNKTMVTLDLENNGITLPGAHTIIEALKNNDSLKDINLWLPNMPRNLRLFLKKSN